MKLSVLGLSIVLVFAYSGAFAAEPVIVNVWPDTPPDEGAPLPPEDTTPKPDARQVAGRDVLRISNVSTPQIAIYRPSKMASQSPAVVICPGGGHRILAYDLEGIEIAEWLNTQGIVGIVLKYRVPFRHQSQKALSGVQDAQRAIRIVRSRSSEFGVAPDKIGIMGFSAGGEVAAHTTLFHDKQHYAKLDAIDDVSCRPDFSMLIYPAYLTDETTSTLKPEIQAAASTPSVFMVHAWDDRVTPLSSVLLAAELKRKNIPCELHLFSQGGHGYGMRHVDGVPVTDWTKLAEPWLHGILKRP